LAGIERAIKKEPKYRTESPRYFLLAFGPEARHHVWLVHDGDVLYVDCNGNGDLTEPGESIKIEAAPAPANSPTTFRKARVGELKVGGLTHRGLEVTIVELPADFKPRTPEERELVEWYGGMTGNPTYFLTATAVSLAPQKSDPPIAAAVTQTAGRDARGCLKFAPRPGSAPVVHFGGPLTFGGPVRLGPGHDVAMVGGTEHTDFYVTLGTPGLGAGTFASLIYLSPGGDKRCIVPEDCHPIAEAVFPPARPGEQPVRRKWVLKQRC